MTHRDHTHDTTRDQEAENLPTSTDEVTGNGGVSGGVVMRGLAPILVPNLLPIGEEIPQRRALPSPNDAASGRGGDISR